MIQSHVLAHKRNGYVCGDNKFTHDINQAQLFSTKDILKTPDAYNNLTIVPVLICESCNDRSSHGDGVYPLDSLKPPTKTGCYWMLPYHGAKPVIAEVVEHYAEPGLLQIMGDNGDLTDFSEFPHARWCSRPIADPVEVPDAR